jgi:conjugative relaxase-like TrwC/TraI family protein
MVTASSIGAAKAGGYARYLESKTVRSDRGDYYLTPDGEPAQAPGRWLASADTLAQLGIEGAMVNGGQFVALMEGRHPQTGRWLRPEGADGGRGGGIDLTFSAPKSVSVVWALGADAHHREEIEAAHTAAVEEAMSYLRETVDTVRRRRLGKVIEEPAIDLVAAEFRHTTARGIMAGDAPDPQLHSHVVITSAVREDGRIVAVASRPIFAAAHEVGAYYRSALAHQLSERGYIIKPGTGKEGRYFEIASVKPEMLEAFSARSREVAHAAERFRAERGRAPNRRELRALKLENRKAKTLVTEHDLHQAWSETANRAHKPREHPASIEFQPRPGVLDDRVEEKLSARAAAFQPRELRKTVLEQSVGELSPRQALAAAEQMIAERRIIPLEGGLLTTHVIRSMEQAIEQRYASFAAAAGRDVGEHARNHAADRVAEAISAPLSSEQAGALKTITGPERAAVLIGPAGTGKGVVIDAAARAEQNAGRRTIGIAVSGSTAQRLGHDSPALAESTLTVDALVARADNGRLKLDKRTTIYLDEAGMIDTDRLARLTRTVERTGAKLVAIGDPAQLPSIGAGGMLPRLACLVPTAELSEVRRTPKRDEQRAWANLRKGRSDKALAYYLDSGRLHMTGTREQAVERAVSWWAQLSKDSPVQEVALISDASNVEIDRLNARAQHHRIERGELGTVEAQIPGVHYGVRSNDRVTLIDQLRQLGFERVENGSQGTVLNVSKQGHVRVEFDCTQRRSVISGDDLARLRLGYASHIHRAQGATVTRTLVVTGGWQTSRETAYVQASRARHGTDWFVNRDELGAAGHDVGRIQRLAHQMSRSHAQTPSLARRELNEHLRGPERYMPIAPSRALAYLAKTLTRAIERSSNDRSR